MLNKLEYDPADFSYNKFTDSIDTTGYDLVNARLMEMAQLSERKRIVDLGCGAGDSTRAVIKRLSSFKDVVVYAVDVSAGALKEAAMRLASFRSDLDIRFIHSDVRNMRGKLADKVDAIVYCNSIHYVKDKLGLVSSVKSQLRPGGVFAFNSSFIRESHEGTERQFYMLLMLNAKRMLRREHQINASEQDGDAVESRNRLGTSDYTAIVEEAGMEVKACEPGLWRMTADQFAKFCNFKDFIEGALPGVPLPIASKALQESTYKAFDSLKMTYLNRRWVNLVARQPA